MNATLATTATYSHGDTDCEHGDKMVTMDLIRTGRKVTSGGREVNEIAKYRPSAQWECEECGAKFLGPLDEFESQGVESVDAIN